MRHTFLKPLILAQICLLSNFALGRINTFETTRLKSTAGAGVGSILMNESAILNPAPLGFFNNSSLYLQKNSSEYQGGASESFNQTYNDNSSNAGYIVADTKKRLKGAIAYTQQKEQFDERQQINVALAAPVDKKSSLGFLYKKTTDEIFDYNTNTKEKEKYQQLTIGASHVVDKDWSIGAILVDPFKSRNGDTRVIVGAQYTFSDIITFMLDAGADYNNDLAETRQYRAAAQLNFYKDLYFRAGTFEDRAADEKGNGIGLAWVGPKLVLEASVKNTTQLGLKEDSDFDAPRTEKISETSFSLSYYF